MRSKACKVVSRCVQHDSKRLPTRLDARPTRLERVQRLDASNSTRCAYNSTRRAYQLDSTRVQDDSMHHTTRLYVLWCQLDALGGSLDALGGSLDARPTRLDARPTRLDARPARLDARTGRLDALHNTTLRAMVSARCARGSLDALVGWLAVLMVSRRNTHDPSRTRDLRVKSSTPTDINLQRK